MNEAAGMAVALEGELVPAERRMVLEGLSTYGNAFAPPRDFERLTVTLRGADGRLVGGLQGATIWKWMQIDELWIHESVRRQGFGSRLLRTAEAEAVRRGCLRARLDTFDFEARGFYERHGYRVYGELLDFPAGHRHFHLSKMLTGGHAVENA